MSPAATGKEADILQAKSLIPYAKAFIDWSVIEWTICLRWSGSEKNLLFFIKMFSTMLWAAQGGDGTEVDQIKHSTKPNLIQQTGVEITILVGCVPWRNLQLRYIMRETVSQSSWEQEWWD